MSLAVAARPSRVPPRPPTSVVLLRGDTEVAEWPIPACEKIDLTLVHRLARLQLVARRAGYSIRLREPPASLRQLLDLVGLAGVVPCSTDPVDLGVEVGGETEGGEQGGVEEAMEP